MDALRYAAVLELGRTEVSLALIDLITYREIKSRKLQIRPLRQPYLHFDVAEIWKFLVAGLKHYQSGYDINAISFASSVAPMALLDQDNALVLPVLHPDDPGPEDLRSVYELVRPTFAETASALTPDNCSVGHQLFWQSRTFPEAFRKVAAIVPWPQYWAWRAGGHLRSETTSLGVTTGRRWQPVRVGRDFSQPVTRQWFDSPT
jgi:sugar (pentulose or hexulose) kinase